MQKGLVFFLVRVAPEAMSRDDRTLKLLSSRLCGEIRLAAWAVGESEKTGEAWGPDSDTSLVFLRGVSSACTTANAVLFGQKLAVLPPDTPESQKTRHTAEICDIPMGALPFQAFPSQFMRDRNTVELPEHYDLATAASNMLKQLHDDAGLYKVKVALAMLPPGLHREAIRLLASDGIHLGDSDNPIEVYKVANGKITVGFPYKYNRFVSAAYGPRDLTEGIASFRKEIPDVRGASGHSMEPAA